MTEYNKRLVVMDLDEANRADLTDYFDSAEFSMDWLGGPHRCTIRMLGSWDAPALPLHTQVWIYSTSHLAPRIYRGVVYQDETSSDGIRLITCESWGDYWLQQVRPIVSFSNRTVRQIWDALVTLYLDSSSYRTYLKIDHLDAPSACGTIIGEFTLDGGMSLAGAFDALVQQVEGYTWGVYDNDLYFRAIPSTVAMTHSVGVDGDVDGVPLVKYADFYTEVLTVGFMADAFKASARIVRDEAAFNAHGLYRHPGIMCRQLRKLSDLTNAGSAFLARHQFGSTQYEFTARAQLGSYMPTIYDGQVRLNNDVAGVELTRGRPSEIAVRLASDLAYSYRFGFDVRADIRAATEETINAAMQSLAESPTPLEYDGRSGYSTPVDDPRDIGDGRPYTTEYASGVGAGRADIVGAVTRLLDLIRDTEVPAVGESLADALATALDVMADEDVKDRVRDALLEVIGDVFDSGDQLFGARLLRAISGAIDDAGVDQAAKTELVESVTNQIVESAAASDNIVQAINDTATGPVDNIILDLSTPIVDSVDSETKRSDVNSLSDFNGSDEIKPRVD